MMTMIKWMWITKKSKFGHTVTMSGCFFFFFFFFFLKKKLLYNRPLQSSQIQSIRQPRVDVRLTSVLQLRKEIKKNEDASKFILIGIYIEFLS
jgi:hypothetical protein